MDLTPYTPARIVRTAANTAFRGAAISPYGRAGVTAWTYRRPIGKAAQFLYKNRKQFVEFAKMNKRRRMGGTPARAMQVGHTVATGDGKKDQITTSLTETWATRALVFYDLTDVKKTTVDIANNLANAELEINKINRRQRQLINIRGFLVNMSFKNNGALPIMINVAIVAPRNNNSDVFSGDGFFRDYNESRDVNFSTTLSAMQLCNLPISTDKYTILFRKKLTVAANQGVPTAINTTSPVNTATLRKYLPFKRQIRFNDDTGKTSENKVFLIWWADTFQATPGTGPQNDYFNTQSLAVTYFDEATRPY